MAWKLKRTKSDEDEPITKGLKGSGDGEEPDFERKPGAFEPVSGYDPEYGAGVDKTVMLLSDADYMPGLIPSVGAPAPEQPIVDADTHEPDFLSSAMSSADEAVNSFQTAKGAPVDITPSLDDDVPTTSGENWDLDAFAPYQPSSISGHDDTPILDATPVAAPLRSSNGIAADDSLASSFTASRLVVRLGQFSASYEVSKPEVVIGRPDPKVEIQPDVAVEWDDAVSRNHARILHKADGDYVEDTGSTNGTKLNNKPLTANKPLLLKDGDKIQLGEKTEIVYVR